MCKLTFAFSKLVKIEIKKPFKYTTLGLKDVKRSFLKKKRFCKNIAVHCHFSTMKYSETSTQVHLGNLEIVRYCEVLCHFANNFLIKLKVVDLNNNH